MYSMTSIKYSLGLQTYDEHTEPFSDEKQICLLIIIFWDIFCQCKIMSSIFLIFQFDWVYVVDLLILLWILEFLVFVINFHSLKLW